MTGRKYICIVQLRGLFLNRRRCLIYRSLLRSLFLVRQRRLICKSLLQSPLLVCQPHLDSRGRWQNLFHTCLHRWNFVILLCQHSVRRRSQRSSRILNEIAGSRFGTNVHPVTVCLTTAATTLLVVLTPSTNSTMTLVGTQITGNAKAGTQVIAGRPKVTGSTAAGIQTTGGRVNGLGRIGASMTVKARGTNVLDATVGIRVTGKRLVGIKRMSITTITLKHHGSLTHSLKLRV